MAGTTKYITYPGGPSGDYVCDGTADDVTINQALAWAASNPGSTVYIRGPYTYDIRLTLRIGSYTAFTGDSTAELRLNDSCMWAAMVPVIGQIGGTGTVSTGIEISGFTINCNESHLTHSSSGRIHGKGYYNAIHIQGQSTKHANNINIHNLTLKDSLGDGVRLGYCSEVKVHNCAMWNMQHCDVFSTDCTNIDVYENDFQVITCSGTRFDNCVNWKARKNNYRDWSGTSGAYKYGAHGVQFGNQPSGHTTLTNNGEICDNTINVSACGIQIEDYYKRAGTSSQTVSIHNNKITGGKTVNPDAPYFAGITIYSWGNGLTIEKNTIDGSTRAGIFVRNSIASGVKVAVRNNNIINSKKAGTVGGYGIYNVVSTSFTVNASGNYATGNVSGNYYKVTPSTQADKFIDDAIPNGGTDVTEPEKPEEPTDPDPGIYVPGTPSIIDDEYPYIERVDDSAYINYVPFQVMKRSGGGSKVVGTSKSPSLAGYNITDFDFDGSQVTFDCVAYDADDLAKILSAFYKKGRSTIEMGGPHKGYKITGVGETHKTPWDSSTDDIPNGRYEYSLTFLTEKPYMERILKRTRGRYIHKSTQFSADDCYAGNLVKNPSFENWPVNTTLNWTSKTTAANNEWRNIKYALELGQWCAVAQTGTGNRIMISGANIVPDISGNNKHGIHTIPGVTPLEGGGLSFDGTGFVTLIDPGIINTTGWTVYNKFSVDDVSAQRVLFGMGSHTSNAPSMYLLIDTDSKIKLGVRDDTNTLYNITSINSVSLNTVYEVVATYNGTTLSIYIDGIFDSSISATYGTTTTTRAAIGELPRISDLYPFSGDIFSTRVLSVCASSVEVPNLGTRTTNLVCAYANVTDQDPGELWIIPPWLSQASNCDSLWRGLAWCPDWMTWVATSVDMNSTACITSEDGGATWLQKATPGTNGWGNCVFLPANDTITDGRLIAFAQSGTGAHTMYSDDKCNTWTEVALPTDVATNGIIASAYSPDLHRVVALCYYGSITKRVVYTDDYGVTYVSVLSPAQKWTGIVWTDNAGLFIAVSEDGTPKQAMTSPTGLEGTWTLQTTPYSSTTKTEAGTKVADLYGISPTGWNYTTLATTYNTSVNPMYTYVLPALSNGDIYRIDNIQARLRSLASRVTAYMKVTIQAASLYSGVETQLVEWKENSTSYQEKSLDLAIESATNEKVTIKFYLRSSSGSTRVGADLMGYTAQERTTGGSSIIYNGNEWRGLVCANNLSLVIAVSQTGNKNRVMTTNLGTLWRLGTTPNDNNYVAIDYSEPQNRFMAIASSGNLDHVMACDGYGTFENVAPADWTLVNPGQSRSEEYVEDGKFSCRVKGDGANKEPGLITQPLPFDLVYDAGELYYLSGKCAVTGLTKGSFKADIYAGGSVVKELVWNTNTDTPKEITFKFDTVPSDVFIRVHGSDTPNLGSECYFDDMVVCRYSDLEIAETGTGITTHGYQNVNPDVRLRGISEVSASASTDKNGGDTSDLNTVYESTSTSYGSAVWTVTLPALTGGSKYRINQLSCKILSSDARGYTYCKVTVQAASLFSGKETDISMWTTHDTVNYKHWIYNLPYALESATNETVTIRYYIRISRTPYTAYATELGYKYTEIVNVPEVNATSVYLYNTADPRIILKICNGCPQGYMVEINANCTGSYRYVESFEDGAFISNAYSVTGNVARNGENDSCVMSAGSAIVFPFDTLYPVTGTPFIKMFVFSGIPQISIADDGGTDGAPGTFYAVDSNTSVSLENEVIERELDNRLNLGLRGLSKYYVKIEPKTGGTCEFTQMLEYASLDTMDAQRPFIYATKEANTFAVVVGDGTGKCSSVIGLGYHDAKIIS